MDAFVKRCEHCKEPVPETKRGRPQRFLFGQMPPSAKSMPLPKVAGRLKPKVASQGSEL